LTFNSLKVTSLAVLWSRREALRVHGLLLPDNGEIVSAVADTRPNRVPLQSTAVRSAGYDEQTRQLVVEYASGHLYQYDSVPLAVYEWLLKVPNKGRYLRTHIVGAYTERRLPESLPPRASLEEQLRNSLVQAQQPQSPPGGSTDG